MQTSLNDRARRVQAAADDWSGADPVIKGAIEDGILADLAKQDWDDPDVNVPSTIWSAAIVCVCILGVLAVYASYRWSLL